MITKDEIQNITRSLGKTLIGFIPAQCPVYVINIKYLSKDNDPFYPIDRVIIQTIYNNPQSSISYLAWILGFEKEIIFSRITHHLVEDGFLTYSPANGLYKITDAGERKYLNESGDRPDVEVTGAIMVDGTTLELLPTSFYDLDNALRYFRQGKTNIPHIPLLGINDTHLQNAVKNIEKIIRKSYFSYGLEENGHNLEIIGYDERYIEDTTVIILADSSGNVSKELYYKGQKVSLAAINKAVERYYFYVDDNGFLHQNHGVSTNDNVKEIICNSKRNVLCALFEKRYNIKDKNFVFSYLLDSKEAGNVYPFSLKINTDFLINTNNKRQLLADARKKIIQFNAREEGSLFVPVISDTVITSYLFFESELDKWKEQHNSVDIEFIKYIKNKINYNWRVILCGIDRFEDLEMIDRKEFFKFE